MSNKKGLPETIKMRHDAHYVEEFAKINRSVGRRIPINLIEPNPEQPRVEIGDLTELSGSIKEKGVLEPILVKPNPETGRWMIIAGERRWRAANLAGLSEMPCIELDIDAKDIAEIALIENLQRKDLTVWEEVDGYAYLVEKFDYTHEEIAKKIGKSRTTVTESLTIAGLPEEIRVKCRQLNLSSKSALLEVARQFDEQSMHDFLSNLNKNSASRDTVRQKSRAARNSEISPPPPPAVSTNTSSETWNPNLFKITSAEGKFNLEINFLKGKGFDKNDVLAVLKEVYNKIKAEQRWSGK